MVSAPLTAQQTLPNQLRRNRWQEIYLLLFFLFSVSLSKLSSYGSLIELDYVTQGSKQQQCASAPCDVTLFITSNYRGDRRAGEHVYLQEPSWWSCPKPAVRETWEEDTAELWHRRRLRVHYRSHWSAAAITTLRKRDCSLGWTRRAKLLSSLSHSAYFARLGITRLPQTLIQEFYGPVSHIRTDKLPSKTQKTVIRNILVAYLFGVHTKFRKL